MEHLIRDLRFALRGLLRQPLFTVVATCTLALGIGANTAIFSFVYGLAFRPLPYPEPDRLMTVWEDHSAFDRPYDEWTGPTTFFDWQKASTKFSSLAAWGGFAPNLTGLGAPERISGQIVTQDFFTVLGVEPAIGRGFVDEEMVDGGPDAVVISHGFWQGRLGGDEQALARTIELGGTPYQVVGIMPKGFHSVLGPGAEVWVPGALPYDDSQRGNYFLRVIGRLTDGGTAQQAEAELEAVMTGLAERFPATYEGIGITIEPLHDRLIGSSRPAIRALMLAVGVVLLIACANVANLLLARASTRRREMALRASLGAGRGRLVQQLITESVLLALFGGVLGLALGAWGVDILRALLPANLPRLDAVVLDTPVLVFAFVVALFTGVVFGLVPALDASRTDLSTAASIGGRSGDRSGGRLRASLVVAEVALALVLLISAGLLIRSVWTLLNEDPGFEADGRLVTRVTIPESDYEDAASVRSFWQRLIERLEGDPAVRQVGATDILPMDGGDQDMSLRIEGAPAADPSQPTVAWYRHVTPRYFETMGMRQLAGRGFAGADRDGAEPVAVVNAAFVRRYLPKAGVEGAIGRRLRRGQTSETPWMTIVGVVGDVQQQGLGEPSRVALFMPFAQRPRRSMVIVLEAAAGDPAALVPLLRAAVGEVDPNLPVASPRRLADVVASSVSLPRLIMQLLGAFAVLALLLAAIGIYGLTAYAVARRTREIGVRMALGARAHDVRRLVIGRGLGLTGLGVGLGLLIALAVGRLISSLLYGISPADPGTLAVTAAILLLTAAVACWLPARRAARLDPVTALRDE